jgi:hypothetical protein
MRLFISYAHANRDRVARLVTGLNRVNHAVWFDEELYGGQDWWEGILEQIEACQVLLLMVSEDSLESPYCQTEYRYAMALGKPVLPILLHRLPLPDDLAKIQYTDISMRIDDAALMEILGSLNQLQNDLSQGRYRTQPRLVPRPSVPKGPLYELKQQVQVIQKESVSQHYQDRLVARLGRYVSRDQNPKIRKEAFDLLQALLQSPYVTEFTRQDIRHILNPVLANTYPTNIKSLVYSLLQHVKSDDPEEARRARQDLHLMLKGNPNLTLRFQSEIYAVLIYELTQIIRHGDPKAAAHAREELLGMLDRSRIGADLEVEIYEVLVAEPLREALSGNTARAQQAREWLKIVLKSPHFMDDTRAEILKSLNARPQSNQMGLVLLVSGVILLVFMGILMWILLHSGEVKQEKNVAAAEPLSSEIPKVPSSAPSILLDWGNPAYLVLSFGESEGDLDLYDLRFVVKIGTARRIYQLNQFRELNDLPDFDLRHVPVEACIVLGRDDDLPEPAPNDCQTVFYDDRGVASVAAQPFWAASSETFEVRLTNVEPRTSRDILLTTCVIRDQNCTTALKES